MDTSFQQIVSQLGQDSSFIKLKLFFSKVFSSFTLVSLLELLTENLDCTLVFVDENIMSINQLLVKHRLIITELNENYMKYMAKKGLAIDCLDSIKANLKLQSLGERGYDKFVFHEQKIHMCKHLYSQLNKEMKNELKLILSLVLFVSPFPRCFLSSDYIS